MKSTSNYASKAFVFALAFAAFAFAGHASAQIMGGAGGNGSSSGYYGNSGTGCTIVSFTSNPATTASGQGATLDWTTNGCMNTTINGGNFTGTQLEPMTGSVATGPLSGTTTFTLSANGPDGSTTASTTVAVTDSQYPYSYTCGNTDTVDNEDPDPNCGTSRQNDFITTAATNVGATTARLNGIALSTPDIFSVYFEYGTSANLGSATVFQTLSNVTTFYVHQNIGTAPSTRYYYRMVAQIVGGPTIRGNILSFTTAPLDKNTTSYVGGSNAGSTTGNSTTTTDDESGGSSVAGASGTAASAATINGVTVTVTDPSDKIQIGDTVSYTINYANGTSSSLHDATMTVVFPLGYTVKQTTQGTMQNATTVVADLGTLAPQQTGSIFIQATVGPNTSTGATLVTSATLDYALASGAHDSAVGYVINHASAENVLAGFALGSGFFPTTLFGWLITIIIILTIILIARRVSKQKHAASHGHGGGHGDAHH